MTLLKAGTTIIFALSLTACNTAQEQIKNALSLSPEYFRDTAIVKDDALDTIATITTENGFQEKKGLLGLVWNDNFIRAFIDKKTGVTKYQIYQWIMYSGDWRFYQVVNYETPAGPTQEPLTIIDRKVISCTASDGCLYKEDFAFEIDEPLLRTIASTYHPGEAKGWRFKYGAKAAEDWNDGMLGAEVAGLLEAVDAYKSRHGLK
jgi:hypothetical protein